MDPVTLATTAAAFLAPYLGKATDKAAEKIGEQIPAAVGKVWNTIRTKFSGKSGAEDASTDLIARPDDQLTQSIFAGQLRKVLEAEPAFATELEQLLSSAEKEMGNTIVNTGPGGVATHGGTAAGAGGVAVGGNVQGGITVGGSEKKG